MTIMTIMMVTMIITVMTRIRRLPPPSSILCWEDSTVQTPQRILQRNASRRKIDNFLLRFTCLTLRDNYEMFDMRLSMSGQVMMVEETVWEDHDTCDHSYDKRCHKSYTTTYTAVQATHGRT